jgi:hypothetical protein
LIVNIGFLVASLRKGATVANPTPFKWAGLAVAVGLVVLKVAQASGYWLEIDDEIVIELVMATLVLWAHVATTDKIGLLPPKPPRPDPVSMAAELDRMPGRPLPPGAGSSDDRDPD